MRFNVSTNLSNEAGLQRDYELLRRLLEAAGHSVHGIMFNTYGITPPPADVTIFVEVINPQHIAKDSQVWLIPNSEWWLPGFNGTLNLVHKVLCKTHDCLRIWSKKVGADKCQYIGWEALDLCDPTIERKPTFLHLAGKSATKNTQAVAAAWRDYGLPYKLTVASWHPHVNHYCKGIPNVNWVERFSEDQLRQVMNENIFHIMPSSYEGYGFAIHEALGCGGVVITVDAPPMNESTGIPLGLRIPVDKIGRFHDAPSYTVCASDIAKRVYLAVDKPAETWIGWRSIARESFLQDREDFRNRFGALINA